ncbi:hypothetical protein [Vibrio phage RYC]|nr:hypothetical protein [Vibrio phage RYC]
MRISELISQLEELKDQHGDLEVKLNTAHNQSLMKATWCGLTYVERPEERIIELYTGEEELEEYLEDNDLNVEDLTKVIEIQSY